MNTEKINRFTDRLPDYLLDHWNEILDEIEHHQPEGPEVSLLVDKVEYAAKMLRVMQLWIEQGKFKRQGINNYIDTVVDGLKNGIYV